MGSAAVAENQQAPPSLLRYLATDFLWYLGYLAAVYAIGWSVVAHIRSPLFWLVVAVFEVWTLLRWRRARSRHRRAWSADEHGGHHDPEQAQRKASLGHSEPLRRFLIVFVAASFLLLVGANLSADPDIADGRTVLLDEAGPDGSGLDLSSTTAVSALGAELAGLAVYNWALLVGAVVITVEVAFVLFRRGRDRRLWFLDSLASLSTQIPFYFIEIFTVVAMIGAYFFIWDNLTPWHLPITWWTIAVGILAADFAYYWEHRTSHEVRLLWTGHAVHHSSPIFNTAVAFRFGPFEPVLAILFHLPLVLIGLHPAIVVLGELSVQAYQFWIHTDVIGRLGPLDRFLNTPSCHRVHHGSDKKYLDRNYGGILIVWDRLFGTYQAEEETPTYGLTTQIDTVNPVKVWFSEFPPLFADLRTARSWGEWWSYLLNRPGWRPRDPAPASPEPAT